MPKPPVVLMDQIHLPVVGSFLSTRTREEPSVPPERVAIRLLPLRAIEAALSVVDHVFAAPEPAAVVTSNVRGHPPTITGSCVVNPPMAPVVFWNCSTSPLTTVPSADV